MKSSTYKTYKTRFSTVNSSHLALLDSCSSIGFPAIRSILCGAILTLGLANTSSANSTNTPTSIYSSTSAGDSRVYVLPEGRPAQNHHRPHRRQDRNPVHGRDRNRPDLVGYCPYENHSEFAVLKNLAYSTSGLDYNSTDAANWALGYLESHACGTTEIFAERYRLLREIAYGSSYMDMNSIDAREFALQKAEYLDVNEIQKMKESYGQIKNFAYSSGGLDLNSTDTSRLAAEWVSRGYCESGTALQAISEAYSKEYKFAYSSSGLDMGSADARHYALGKIAYLSQCGDILIRY